MARNTLRRLGRLATRLFMWTLLGVALLVAVLLAAVNLKPVSALIAEQINAALAPTLTGRVQIERLGWLALNGVTGAEVSVRDAADREVLRARGVDAEIATGRLLRSLLGGGSEPVALHITKAHVQAAVVKLIDDGEGVPSLAGAFQPREQPAEPEESGPGTYLLVSDIRLGSVAISGNLADMPIDADIREFDAEVEVNAGATRISLRGLELEARQVPSVDTLRGRLHGEVLLGASGTNEKRVDAAHSDADGTTEPVTKVRALSVAPAATEPHVSAGFDGYVGAADPIVLSFELLGEHLEGQLTAKSLSAATLSKVAGLSPKSPAALSASIEGGFDDFGFEASVRQSSALLSSRGRLRRDEEQTRITSHVDARGVDLDELLTDAPDTRIGLDADATISITSQATRATYRAVVADSSVDGMPLPRATLEGDATLPSDQPALVKGTLQIDEPGAPTEVHYDVSAGDAGTVVDLTSNTRLARPKRLADLAGGLALSGSLNSRVHLDQARAHLDATARLQLHELNHPSARVGSLAATLNAKGPLGAPEIALDSQLRRITGFGRTLPWATLRVNGSPEQLELAVRTRTGKKQTLDARATVTLPPAAAGVRVTKPSLVLTSPAGTLRVSATHVKTTPAGSIEIEQLALSGAGRAEASITYAPNGALEANLKTERLDAGRIADILDTPLPLRVSDISLEGKLATARGTGELRGHIGGIDFGKLKGSVDTDLALTRGRLSGKAHFDLDRAGRAELLVDELRVPLPPFTEQKLEATNGDLSLNGDLDLAQLQPFLPLLNVEKTQGRLTFDLGFERPIGSTRTPELHARVKTKSLVLVGEREKTPQTPNVEQAEQAAPWTVRGVDFDVDARLSAKEAAVDLHLFDRLGALLDAEARFSELGNILSAEQARRNFLKAPLTARVQIPRRSVERLPTSFRPTEIEGVLSAQLDLRGSLAEPELDARARFERFRPLTEQGGQKGVDIETQARYRASGGSARVVAHDRKQALLELVSSWQGDALEFGATPEPASSPVTVDLDLDLSNFPLALIPALQNRKVAGRVSGKARLEHFGRDAALEVDVTTEQLEIDRLSFTQLRSKLRAAGGQLTMDTSMNGKAGSARLRAESGITWGAEMAPTLTGALQGRFDAKALRLGAFMPLVEGSMSELDGKLDAEFQASYEAGTPKLQGRAKLTDGVAQVPSIGQRFQGIAAEVTLTPGLLTVKNVRARGLTGGLEADAEAQLEGLMPVSARAEVRIAEDDKLPLTVEGEAIGDAWGTVEARYDHKDKRETKLHVNLKKLHVDLPDAPPQGIQALDQPAHIRVGYRGNDGFVRIPLQPISDTSSEAAQGGEPQQTTVVVDIGEVSVKKGDQAEVVLTGQIEASLGEELSVAGKVEARRGKLDISGKQFDIERATVTFTGGKPDDPTISALARYDSPDGYTVYAEYTGTVNSGKLRLRSEPSLSQDEILTLLMFGSPDGSLGAGESGDSLSTAVSVAGGAATQGLNRALSDVTDLDVSTRIDTSTGSPRPELVLQLTPRVTAKVTQALGEPIPGQSPDRTFFTVELRLSRAWALSAMVGDRGASALDLIWRRRY